MAFPDIDPSEVGVTGLIWLFLSYGYLLYFASGLIGEGSELLLLVPSMAGLVGGVVLPLLGAVPDGAIVAFSGMGDISTAQDSLSVGVGALAGSTIMLLTVPFALAIFGGRVDYDDNGKPKYNGKPKLTKKDTLYAELTTTGVVVSDAVNQGGILMMITTIPYFLIQIPASFMTGESDTEVGENEFWYALLGFCCCLAGLVYYMYLQLKISSESGDKNKRVAVMKKLLKEGKVSLAGALKAFIMESAINNVDSSVYQSITQDDVPEPSSDAIEYLKEVLKDAFLTYDEDRSGILDEKEVFTFFRDFHENIKEKEMQNLFQHFDKNGNGTIDFEEFIRMTYTIVVKNERFARNPVVEEVTEQATEILEDDEEEEEVPEEFTDLSPEEQQAAIKKKAFWMLFVGTTLVVVFSDPMVDVLSEIAVRINVSSFYVSFVLAPLASNASEVLASLYYASKKTNKTITVALTALEGAACMNNTFCLSIFMALILIRGLAWSYTAETITIVIVEYVMGYFVQRNSLSTLHGIIILMIFPLSIVSVAVLEAIGLD